MAHTPDEKAQKAEAESEGQAEVGALGEQCVMDYEPAEGIAFSTASGVAALADFNKFPEGREAAVAATRERFCPTA